MMRVTFVVTNMELVIMHKFSVQNRSRKKQSAGGTETLFDVLMTSHLAGVSKTISWNVLRWHGFNNYFCRTPFDNVFPLDVQHINLPIIVKNTTLTQCVECRFHHIVNVTYAFIGRVQLNCYVKPFVCKPIMPITRKFCINSRFKQRCAWCKKTFWPFKTPIRIDAWGKRDG